jgi:hypothetical protein
MVFKKKNQSRSYLNHLVHGVNLCGAGDPAAYFIQTVSKFAPLSLLTLLQLGYMSAFFYFAVKLVINPFVTSGTYMSHLKRVFQVRWNNSIPLFLHAAI